MIVVKKNIITLTTGYLWLASHTQQLFALRAEKVSGLTTSHCHVGAKHQVSLEPRWPRAAAKVSGQPKGPQVYCPRSVLPPRGVAQEGLGTRLANTYILN